MPKTASVPKTAFVRGVIIRPQTADKSDYIFAVLCLISLLIFYDIVSKLSIPCCFRCYRRYIRRIQGSSAQISCI